MIFLYLIFLLFFFLMLHSYIIYPRLLGWWFSKSKEKAVYNELKEQYEVSIIMSVFNEVLVIEKKIQSILEQEVFNGNWKLYIGSDASTDGTNEILSRYAALYPQQIQIFYFEGRQGKPRIINQIFDQIFGNQSIGENQILILTDANVYFSKQLISEILKPFQDAQIGAVDSYIKHPLRSGRGISHDESQYIDSEVQLKHWEGALWGTMIGPLGGCYAIRAQFYEPVPPGFVVDDFFIVMHVLLKGSKAVNRLSAVCYEDVSEELSVEFGRKSRIGKGNFKNLVYFRSLLLPQKGALAFCFWSHKVVRWVGPFLILGMMSVIFLLYLNQNNNLLHQILFTTMLIVVFGVPLTHYILDYFRIRNKILRKLTYFLAMNVALFVGFVKFLKKDDQNIWKPTKRNV
jgi:glycosyltransferase involved in cell wall biosynthesis